MSNSSLELRGRRLDSGPSRGAHSWRRYLLGVPTVLALSLLPVLTVGGAPASAQEGPYIVVSPGPGMGGFVDSIEGGGWPDGATVTLRILDLPDGPAVYTDTTVAHPGTFGPYDFGFNLEGTFDVQAGQTIIVSDVPNGGDITKTTTATRLTETLVDPGTDTVTGTAEAYSAVFVQVFGTAATRNVQANGLGYWTADFSVPGDPPDDVTYDITGGTAVGATQYDAEGNQTAAALLPPRGITASPNTSLSDGQTVSVSGFGLTPGVSYALEQCVQGAFWHLCDSSYQVPLTLDAEGNFDSTDFLVHTNINVTGGDPDETIPIDCTSGDYQGCYVGVISVEYSDYSGSIKAPIGFAGMRVSPNIGLADGQTVSVSGSGLTPGVSYVLEQCVQGLFWHSCDPSSQVPLTVDENGYFESTDFLVRTNINVPLPGADPDPAETIPIDCINGDYEGCDVAVIGGDYSGFPGSMTVFIKFGGMTVSPNMSLSDGQTVSVSGFGLTPGVSYVLEQCVQGQFWSNCDTSYQVPLTLDENGNFSSTDFLVHTNINVPGGDPGETTPIDCINGGYWGCDVAVISVDDSEIVGSMEVFIDFVTPPCGALQNCESAFSPSPDGSVTVTSPGESGPVTVSATGGGGITVGSYDTDPVGPPTFLASAGYFDVQVSTPNSFTTVTIVNCALEGGTGVQWWNPASGTTGAWQPVSNQSYSPGPPACVTITVNATTSPSLAQLTGTVFAAQITPAVITSTSLPLSGTVVPVNTATPTLSTGFSDVGAGTHTCTTDWGDGTFSIVAASPDGATGTCAVLHSYGTDGVFNVTTTVTNSAGATSLPATVQIVVYDPSAGFVTGGGWIASPAGAYPANPSLTGRATFGFVSKYHKGAAVPTGQTEFQLQTAGFSFHSDAYQWMVVAGAKAQYKGTGSVNSVPGYGFMVTALDGNLLNKRAIDGFRIKIVAPDGTIFYDNVPSATDSASAMPLTPLGGGNIVIHKS